MPDWADEKEDGWKALVSRWLGEDATFKAVSDRNKKNRGSSGTHGAGNRNHNRLKKKMVYTYSWNKLHSFFST